MPANWYIPSSAQATLTVGVPRGDIVDFRVTPAAEEGEIIGPATEPVQIGVRNVGSLAGAISLAIIDRYDNSIVWTGSSKILAIDEFEFVNAFPAYPMPARDLTLRAQAYHGLVIDSYMDETVVLIVRVDTATTLTLAPPSIEPEGIYHYKGKLTRTDTDAGIAEMDIVARRYEAGSWADVGNGVTDANGDYDISVTAPTTVGAYNCMAAFLGVVPFGASYAQIRLGVGMVILALAMAMHVVRKVLVMVKRIPEEGKAELSKVTGD